MFQKAIITCLTLLTFSLTYSQSAADKDSLKLVMEKLSDRYDRNQLSDTAYMNEADRTIKIALAQGVVMTNEELLQQLSVFRSIAWSRNSYSEYKRKYYALLSNLAQAAWRGGEMLFYADKLEKLDSALGKVPSLAALTIKADYYKTRESLHKVKQLYEEQKKYLALLPSLIRNKKLTDKDGIQSLLCLQKFGEGIYRLKDTAALDNIYSLMDTIASIIRSRNPDNIVFNAYIACSIASAMSNRAIVRNDTPGRLLAMKILDTVINDDAAPQEMKSYARLALMEAKIVFFRELGNADSLRRWLDLYEKNPATADDNETKYFIESERAQQFLLNKDYATGVQHLLSSIDFLKKSKTELLDDVDGILYAHAQAEDNRIELERSQQFIKKRTELIILVAAVVALIIILMAAYFIRSRKVLQRRIATLDKETKAQIESIDQLRQMSMWEEQQRISKEIHDNWLSELVVHIHNIDTIKTNTSDESIKPSLKKLETQAIETYNSLRNLTHNLNNTQHEVDDDLFEKRIKTLAGRALPDNKYTKNIHIGKGAMKFINLTKRIELLRIIQEAIANILKHASAKEVTILLYEEDENVQLTVSDDGKGFDSSKVINNKNALGIASIRNRTVTLGGVLNIESGRSGTSLQVVFPAGNNLLFDN